MKKKLQYFYQHPKYNQATDIFILSYQENSSVKKEYQDKGMEKVSEEEFAHTQYEPNSVKTIDKMI